ncbi:MAG: hypothetical protein IJU64_03525 [Bacilli bacterium]|nr:hypothetical protein [Bacilli bacterium]
MNLKRNILAIGALASITIAMGAIGGVTYASFKRNQTISETIPLSYLYLRPTGIWEYDSPGFALYYFKSSDNSDHGTITPVGNKLDADGTHHIYWFEWPAAKYDRFVFLRVNPSTWSTYDPFGTGFWTQTLDLNFYAKCNAFEITVLNQDNSGKSNGSWKIYSDSRFRDP